MSKAKNFEATHGADWLRSRFIYDPLTGEITRRSNGKPVCSQVGALGYLHGTVDYVTVYAHRVAYCMHHGHWPVNDIDHNDEDKANNRADNLEDVTKSENQRRRGSKLVSAGVYAMRDQWQVRGRFKGKPCYLGTYKDKGEAEQVATNFVTPLDNTV